MFSFLPCPTPLAILMVVSKHNARIHERCNNYLTFDDFKWQVNVEIFTCTFIKMFQIYYGNMCISSKQI
jgi:hypothetical protein